jgi:predicted helicase
VKAVLGRLGLLPIVKRLREAVWAQYKEKKPKDPTIREKFNTYRFADYKEKVIDLLLRVTTVSLRTVEITKAMEKATR